MDSGDLARLTVECRKAFDYENLSSVNIFETNDLDEYSIQKIATNISKYCEKNNVSASDTFNKCVWACGTMPGTCADQSSLGGVAKLTSIEGRGKFH